MQGKCIAHNFVRLGYELEGCVLQTCQTKALSWKLF